MDLKTVQAGKMVFSHAKRGFEKVTALFQSPWLMDCFKPSVLSLQFHRES